MADAIELCRNGLAESAYSAIAAQKAQQESEEAQTSQPGYYVGLEGSTGLAIVTLPDGSTVKGRLITPKQLKAGDRCSVTRNYGSPLCDIDGMN